MANARLECITHPLARDPLQTNTTREIVRDLQRAPNAAGHAPGPLDGIVGHEIMAAVRCSQQAAGPPGGGPTLATLKSLEVL